MIIDDDSAPKAPSFTKEQVFKEYSRLYAMKEWTIEQALTYAAMLSLACADLYHRVGIEIPKGDQ